MKICLEITQIKSNDKSVDFLSYWQWMGKNEKERERGLTWAVIGRRCHCEAHSLWSFRPQRFDNLQLFVSELRFFAKPKPKPNRAQVQSATGLAILGWERERERHWERERERERVVVCVGPGLDDLQIGSQRPRRSHTYSDSVAPCSPYPRTRPHSPFCPFPAQALLVALITTNIPIGHKCA